MPVARGDAVALTRALVRIDSRNPSLVPGAPGESNVARELADILDAWGFRVEIVEAARGRPSIVARIGTPGGRSLMFNGHMDTGTPMRTFATALSRVNPTMLVRRRRGRPSVMPSRSTKQTGSCGRFT